MSPLFVKTEEAPTPVEVAYDPAVRSQIQRVRLDLLSRETERLEQQLRQVLEQQNEDRELREELRGQISSLNRRIESLLAGGAAKAAESGGTDGDLRTAVKPLLQAVMQMLDSAEATGSAEPLSSEGFSEAWAQIDAARQEHLPSTTSPSVAEISVERTQEAAPAPDADSTDTEDRAGQPDSLDTPGPDLPAADSTPATATDPEDDLDLDPEAGLRIEIARLLRPKKAGGGYEPLKPQAKTTAEPAESELKPPHSSDTDAQSTEPGPLLLGTEETPKVDDFSPSKSRTTDADRGGAVSSAPVSGQSDRPSDEPKADAAQGDLRGGGAVPRGNRPSWAPRPNPMRASLPKCLTEPWEEPSRNSGGRWPFRRTRPAGGRNDPKE